MAKKKKESSSPSNLGSSYEEGEANALPLVESRERGRKEKGRRKKTTPCAPFRESFEGRRKRGERPAMLS